MTKTIPKVRAYKDSYAEFGSTLSYTTIINKEEDNPKKFETAAELRDNEKKIQKKGVMARQQNALHIIFGMNLKIILIIFLIKKV